MAERRGKGIPTRKTPGGIGDIYTNTDTGNRYKCIFAYGNKDGAYDTEWEPIDKVEVSVPKKAVEVKEIENAIETADGKKITIVPTTGDKKQSQTRKPNYTPYGKMQK